MVTVADTMKPSALARPKITCSTHQVREALIQPFARMWDPREPPDAEHVARCLPKFKIEKELGRGALGSVYGAIDTRLDRIVAIKAMLWNTSTPKASSIAM